MNSDAASHYEIIQNDSITFSQDTAVSDSINTFSQQDSLLNHFYSTPEQEEFRFADEENSTWQKNKDDFSSHLFSDHSLKPGDIAPYSFQKPNPDWLIIIVLILLAAFAVLKIFYSKIFKQLIAAFFNNSVTNQVVRDENILVQRASILLSVMFYFTASLFLYQVSEFFGWSNPIMAEGFSRYIIFALFLAMVYSVKMVFLKIFGSIFNADRQVAAYIFNIFLINNVLGIFLLPVIIILAFVDFSLIQYVFYGALAVITCCYAYRLIRGVSIGLGIPGFSLFHLILYLCAFEFAPLGIIYKLAL
jgi:hypothetical protein